MREVRATFDIKAPLRKQGSEKSHGIRQVGGVCKGRGGPVFALENHTVSLALLPTL